MILIFHRQVKNEKKNYTIEPKKIENRKGIPFKITFVGKYVKTRYRILK